MTVSNFESDYNHHAFHVQCSVSLSLNWVRVFGEGVGETKAQVRGEGVAKAKSTFAYPKINNG